MLRSKQVHQEHLETQLCHLQQELSELQGKHAEAHARAGLVEGLQHAHTQLQHEISKAHLEMDHLERKAAAGAQAESLHSQVWDVSVLSLCPSINPLPHGLCEGAELFFGQKKEIPHERDIHSCHRFFRCPPWGTVRPVFTYKLEVPRSVSR